MATGSRDAAHASCTTQNAGWLRFAFNDSKIISKHGMFFQVRRQLVGHGYKTEATLPQSCRSPSSMLGRQSLTRQRTGGGIHTANGRTAFVQWQQRRVWSSETSTETAADESTVLRLRFHWQRSDEPRWSHVGHRCRQLSTGMRCHFRTLPFSAKYKLKS